MEKTKLRVCPDGGTCHHECPGESAISCSRVRSCGPLSGVFPGDRWPEDMAIGAMVFAVEMQNDRSNHVKAHCNNLGPYTRTNPKYCIHCGKLGGLWSAFNEPCTFVHPWFSMSHLSDTEKTEMQARLDYYEALDFDTLRAEIYARGIGAEDEPARHMCPRLSYHDTGLEPTG